MISHSTTDFVNLQGKISNFPKENNTETVLKISVMGSEIKLLRREQPIVWKVWTCWREKISSLSPLQHVIKLLGESGSLWASNQCSWNSWCPVSLLPCYCYLLQNLRIETETKNSLRQLQKVSWERVVNSNTCKSTVEINGNSVSLYLQWSFANSSYTASSWRQWVVSLACH